MPVAETKPSVAKVELSFGDFSVRDPNYPLARPIARCRTPGDVVSHISKHYEHGFTLDVSGLGNFYRHQGEQIVSGLKGRYREVVPRIQAAP